MCFRSAGSTILVGRQRFPKKELEGQRYTWFYLELYLKIGLKPGAHRQNPACNRILCGWSCVLLNLDVNDFVNSGGMCEATQSLIPGSLRPTAPCCLHNSITHSVSRQI